MKLRLVALGWWLSALSLLAIPMRKGADEIPPLAPPLPVIPPTLYERFGWVLWVVLLFALLVMALVAVLLLRPRQPPVLHAPATEARAMLVPLLNRVEDDATLGKAAHTLRRYLIAVFWLPAGETTTAEFCLMLKPNPQIGAELSWAVGEFLMRCDEFKFSPASRPADFGAVRRALELIDMAEAQRVRVSALPGSAKPA